MGNFWQELKNKKKPFLCVAPMADVTDPAFRRLIVKYGKPDVMWTEFVSANGLMSAGRDALLLDLSFSDEERPIVAQLFSADEKNMEGAAKLCSELGFDGIDINMGCPDKTIEKQGAGAAMIKNPEIAGKIIAAVKRGIKNAGKDIPVSVKTRVGYNSVQLQEWIPYLLKQDLAALTVHARTRKELSKVPANWHHVREVVKMRDKIAPNTLIIGNGDVVSIDDAKEKAKFSGCDGVMIGRALFGNPWFFDESRSVQAGLPKKRASWIRKIPLLSNIFETKRVAPQSDSKPIAVEERLRTLVEHTKLFEELLGEAKSFAVMKKHFKAYCTGFEGAKELRMKLMESANAKDVENAISAFLIQ